MITTVETLSFIILSIISLPKLCGLIKRPSLLYSAYLLIGILLGGFINVNTRLMLQETGNIGFILLLFLIGLEIDIPCPNDLKEGSRFAMIWYLLQLPLVIAVSWFAGLDYQTGLTAGAGICACSLGVAYKILEGQKNAIPLKENRMMLYQMVMIEVISLILLVMADSLHVYGNPRAILGQFLILVLFILFIRMSAGAMQNYLAHLLKSTSKWKVHRLFLALFFFVIIGEKLGLSPPKTAFFLGLFMSATTHDGLKFEEELKGVAQRILIPIFFISLGAKISLSSLTGWILPAASIIVFVLFCIRSLIFHYISKDSVPLKYFLILCPNITMVAVATEILLHQKVDGYLIDLLLVAGFLLTVIPALLFPQRNISEKTSINLEGSPQGLINSGNPI